MKKVLLVVLIILIVGLLFWLFTKPARATFVSWSKCESIGAQCGTDNGTQSRTLYDYKDPICPKDYHVQNSGNWNQRCHRNFNWMHPEHKAPIGCPKDYEQVGANCVKELKETRECNTGEIQYDSCEPEGQCPTECGYEGGEVADGKGGYLVCEETKECEVPEEPKKEPKTFTEDTRCLDTTPPAITWVNVEDGSANNDWLPRATWSAEGGDTIEVCFSETLGDPRWCFAMENDGHETLGLVENTGLLGMVQYYANWRVVNGCKTSDWTAVDWFN